MKSTLDTLVNPRPYPGNPTASQGTQYAFSYDAQDSLVQRQTGGNTSYSALDTAMYDAYGSRLNDVDVFTGGAEPVRDAVGFQGQFGAYTDTETGLVLMGHRYYSPGTGRFLTRDPMGYGGGINLYGFTGNNPVNEMDPSGFNPVSDFFGGASDNINPIKIVTGIGALSKYLVGPGSVGTKASTLARGFGNSLNPFTAKNPHELGQRIGGDALLFTGIGAISKVRALGAAGAAARAAEVASTGVASQSSDWALLSGMFRDAAAGKGNFGVGSATLEQSEVLGKAWVGNGYKVASDGKTLVSANRLRQYRPASWKPSQGKWQANLEQRFPGQVSKAWQSNAHVDIISP